MVRLAIWEEHVGPRAGGNKFEKWLGTSIYNYFVVSILTVLIFLRCINSMYYIIMLKCCFNQLD